MKQTLPFLAGCAIKVGSLFKSRFSLESAEQNWAAPQALGNGRYELCEFIGKGGMGAVYRARDVELDRSVAVKCLLDVARQGSRQLAVKEAKTLASLSHPNIMRVFDILSGGDQVWIVSEWLEGQSLAQLPLPLPPGCVLAIMTQIYDALAAAHTAQVIHRDIKPSNVMIGKDGRVMLIDFGVAYAPGTSTGETLVGSLRYTDPRILEGEPPDAWSDLFSAALLQTELMTGETVLPDLAPLPLYRHIKRGLENRLDGLLDGAYPPLVNLAHRFTSRGRLAQDAAQGPTTAREAALLSLDALRKLTQKTPEGYLADGLCRGAIVDPLAERIISEEAAAALHGTILTPREKAAWIAFKAATETPGDAGSPRTVRLSESAERTPRTGDPAQANGERRPPARLRTLLAGIGLAALVLLSVVLWMRLENPQPAIFGDKVATAVPPLLAPLPDPVGALTAPVASAPAAAETAPPAPSTPVERPKAAKPALSSGLSSAAAAAMPLPDTAANGLASDHLAVPVHLVANAWAVVRIDGREVGRLPQAAPFPLPPGVHTLQLSNPAVETLDTEIRVSAGKAARFRFTLKPKVAPCKIRLAQPGRLFIDGIDHGVVSSKTVPLRYGTHQIWVQRGLETSRPRSIALAPGSPSEIRIE